VRGNAKNVDREAFIDTFNNVTFDYEGNAMVVREINVEHMRPPGIVQNPFKVLSAIEPIQRDQNHSRSEEPRKRLEAPRKLQHPLNILRSKNQSVM
jgi:hypothetical protein